jgi:hypothetical protein
MGLINNKCLYYLQFNTILIFETVLLILNIQEIAYVQLAAKRVAAETDAFCDIPHSLHANNI